MRSALGTVSMMWANYLGIITKFNCKKSPSISIRDYVERCANYIKCDEAIFAASLIYIDRVVSKNPSFLITSRNIHRFVYSPKIIRLLITCIMVADKFSSDSFLRNTDYALVGGVSNAELNLLEHELVSLLDFELNIDEQKFTTYSDKLSAFVIPEQQRKIKQDPLRKISFRDRADKGAEILVDGDPNNSCTRIP